MKKSNIIFLVIVALVGLVLIFWQKIVAKTTKTASTSVIESFRETQKVGEIAKGVGKQAATGAVEVATNWLNSKINKI